MKQIPIALLTLFFLALACRSNNIPPAPKTQDSTDTGKFYPIGEFFQSQIAYVDLRNFTITQKNDIDGKKDSFNISKERFIALARVFAEKDISSPRIKKMYKETVFHDLSTESYTLNYSPLQPGLAIQNIDVLLDDQHKQVKRIFIRSIYTRGDTTITEQCSWKTNNSFLIARYGQTKKGHNSNSLIFVNWNETPLQKKAQ